MNDLQESEKLDEFLKSLSNKVIYAIERDVGSVCRPLVGDIDMLIRENDFPLLIQIAREAGILISITRSYGGARIFIGYGTKTIKRIDCVWRLHYRGILLTSAEELLEQRVIDSCTGLYVLPEKQQAQVVYFVKNAYGGAYKYLELLKRYGLSVLNSRERLLWLGALILRHPIAFVKGFVEYISSYLARLFSPTGLLVHGVPVDRISSSVAVRYLFQGRVRREDSLMMAFFRARLLSEVCVIPYGWAAQLRFSPEISTVECEREIFQFLRSKLK